MIKKTPDDNEPVPSSEFPEEILKSWVEIPEDELVQLPPIPRGYIDYFLFSTLNSADSLAQTQLAVEQIILGNNKNAQEFLQKAERANLIANWRFRTFFQSIFEKILEERARGRT